jgi:hypothetical protein
MTDDAKTCLETPRIALSITQLITGVMHRHKRTDIGQISKTTMIMMVETVTKGLEWVFDVHPTGQEVRRGTESEPRDDRPTLADIAAARCTTGLSAGKTDGTHCANATNQGLMRSVWPGKRVTGSTRVANPPRRKGFRARCCNILHTL